MMAALAILWLGVSCDGPHDHTSAVPAGDTTGPHGVDRATYDRLRQIALQAAEGLGGSVKSAEAVKSRHSAAVQVTSGSFVPGNEDVWAIQVEGFDEFVCDRCSRPSNDVPAPRGRFITIVLDAKTFESTDDGISSRRVDLSKLGTVIDLTN
jgi:hypothetical protein